MKKYKFVANPIPKSVKDAKDVPSRVKSSKADDGNHSIFESF